MTGSSSLIAFVAAVGVDLIQRQMTRRRLPGFYQQVAGGLLATLLAVGTVAAGVDVDPSLVVTAGIILLLAGINFMGAIQDALTGFPLTAGARILEAMLATAGVIAGVSGGLTVGRMLGVNLGRLDPGGDVVQRPAGDDARCGDHGRGVRLRVLRAAALAAADRGDRRGRRRWSSTWRSTAASGSRGRAAVAAVLIGMVSYAVAGRVRVPPLVIVVSGDRAAAARPVDLPRAVPAVRGRQRPAVDHQRGRDRDRPGLRRDLRGVRRPAAQARGPTARGPALRTAAGRPAAGAHRPAAPARPTRAEPAQLSGPRTPAAPAGVDLADLDPLDAGVRRPCVHPRDQRGRRRPAAPSNSACTVPSGSLDTQPATPAVRAPPGGTSPGRTRPAPGRARRPRARDLGSRLHRRTRPARRARPAAATRSYGAPRARSRRPGPPRTTSPPSRTRSVGIAELTRCAANSSSSSTQTRPLQPRTTSRSRSTAVTVSPAHDRDGRDVDVHVAVRGAAAARRTSPRTRRRGARG